MWKIVLFRDHCGNVTEYLATQKGIGYFHPSHNPEIYMDEKELVGEDAMEIAQFKNNQLRKEA